MLDTGVKKKGILSIVTMSVLIVVMGVIVSCGYKAGEGNGDSGNGGAGNGSAADGELQGEDEQKTGHSDENASEENDAGNGGPYAVHRGMEIDGKYLYFSGSASEEKEDTATVYRMDLETREVVDALAEFSMEYSDYLITNVSVNEGNLYAAIGAASERYGFVLNENGEAVSRLDQQAAETMNMYAIPWDSRRLLRKQGYIIRTLQVKSGMQILRQNRRSNFMEEMKESW